MSALWQRQFPKGPPSPMNCALPTTTAGCASAACRTSHVGGDWYDAFTLSDGATALAVGDVVGHDLEAAAGMAQLRSGVGHR